MEYGKYDIGLDEGVGMLKIYEKHTVMNNEFKDWGVEWSTQVNILDSILKILETKTEIDYKFTADQGRSYLYELEINGEIKYLRIGVGTNGFILSAYRYHSDHL